MDNTEATIKQLEEETKQLLKEAAGTIPKATPANFVDSVMDTIGDQIPDNMSILPEGMAFVEQFKGALILFATTLEKAKSDLGKQQQQQQQAEAQQAALQAEQVLQPAGPAQAANTDDFNIDEEQIDAFIRDIVGEHDQDMESEEQWKAKVQRQKANFSKAGIARLKVLKVKGGKK